MLGQDVDFGAALAADAGGRAAGSRRGVVLQEDPKSFEDISRCILNASIPCREDAKGWIKHMINSRNSKQLCRT